MSHRSPHVVVIAGPNGSGKSSATPDLLRDYLQLNDFFNAGVICVRVGTVDVNSRRECAVQTTA